MKNVSLIGNNCSNFWENGSGNKALVWTDFKNFFAWLTDMKKNDFWLYWIFWLRSFFGHFFRSHGSKKWPKPKKSLKSKISFFMPVNHAKEFLKSVQNEALFSQLFASTLSSYFQSVKHFSKKKFSEKSFQMVSTISGWMGSEIWEP